MDVAIWAAIIGGLFAILAALITLWPRRKVHHEVALTVRRVCATDDPDILPALELFARRLPENERDSPENIVRWLEEVRTETAEGRCKLVDYFLVAKSGIRVVGLLYAHYYVADRFLLISYLVIDDDVSETRRCLASRALLTYMSLELKRTLKKCQGILFELEYADTKGKKNLARLARARHFRALARMQGITTKELLIDYRQPKLSLWEPGRKEERLHLMYGRTRSPHLSDSIPRAEAKSILEFMYDQIYGDHFEDDPTKDKQYRDYVGGLREKTVADLPDRVPVY